MMLTALLIISHTVKPGSVLTFWGPGAKLNLGALNINKSMYFQKYFESLVKENTVCFSFFFTIYTICSCLSLFVSNISGSFIVMFIL